MRREDKDSSGEWSCPSCPAVGHETSKHAVLCPVRRGMLLDASVRAQCLAEEAAERRGTLGVVTESPADYARKAFRALRYDPHYGMSVGALMSLCRSGRLTEPRRALAAIARSLVACSCDSGICGAHGWRPPQDTVCKLREVLMLETDLFAVPASVDVNLQQWFSPDTHHSAMGSAGCPWARDWGGMFALCAPRLSPGREMDVVGRLVVKALAAVNGPRPTRIVLVVSGALSVLNQFDCLRIGGAKVVILENDAAVALSSKLGGATPSATGFRWPGPCSSGRARSLVPFWHPLAVMAAPPWLRSACWETRDAFRSVDDHDRYAGALGVLPKRFPLVLACLLQDRDRPLSRTRAAADQAIPVTIMALFRGAYAAWKHSRLARRVWWKHMSAAVMDSEIELAQLRLHQRQQSTAKRKYAFATSRSASKRRRLAHLDAIADRMGVTRSSLVASYPEARESVPAVLAAVAPPPEEPGWHGTLRSNPPRVRLSLCDDYVGEDTPRRRKSRRSLRGERAAVARRFGR